ncbi:MAG: hypothetical protein Q8Q09_29110 [Deltaproteobacteria bacterium]|nr:hypothetical protein [Deltaproteobacteria bacterium]
MNDRRLLRTLALGIACLSTACAGSRAVRSAQGHPSYRSGSSATSVQEAATDDNRSPSQASPAPPPSVASTTTATGASVGGENGADLDGVTNFGGAVAPQDRVPARQVVSDDAVSRASVRLAAAEQQLQASPSVCRDVCRATADICSASREICSLVGDRDNETATDVRCARARASCDRASRQREGACPVCTE